ncbi:MAG: GDYXXLXY domain-containing protein [Roseibium sp.]
MSDTAMNTAPSNAGPLLRNPYLKWGVLALIQLALISIPLADRLQVQMSGQDVTLELIPVDPRDLLRGDYVIITLAIGQLPAELPGTNGFTSGDTIYVELQPNADGVAKPVKAASERRKLGPMSIAGTVVTATAEQINVDYGIDAFFLPEGEGLEVERLDRDQVRLIVAVTDDGRSLPLRLLVDGMPFKSDAAF